MADQRRVGALNDVDYGEFKEDIAARVEPVLKAERNEWWRLGNQGGEGRKEGKREADRGNAVEAAETEANVKSRDELAAIASPTTRAWASAPVYTGLVPVVYKAQREMLNGLAWNFVTDLLTIASVMTIVFWDFSAGLILLVPSVFPMVIVFGIMGWMGIVIDVGTIMTPTVALGVSVDDVVHFLIWYRRGLADGKNRKERDHAGLRRLRTSHVPELGRAGLSAWPCSRSVRSCPRNVSAP